jgi:hypothetical protein
MTSEMSVAAILRVVDVNDARGYYHCSDGPNFTYGYYRNHPGRCCVLVCSSGSKLNLQVHAQLEPLHHPYQLGSGVAASIGASSSRWG